MFYNYQREYDPVVGRYSQSDRIGLAGGISTFSYVSARTVKRVDPKGLRELQRLAGQLADTGRSSEMDTAGVVASSATAAQFM
ncbi:RHS repeat-associated core domain-containing protein, partial [Enterobacter hormaechei]|uniref:RHS repeat-associated core domain-containing protein n=1 Tax=Enterobacter hormaechei TaxID=158836 RepID=UPI0023EF2930